jgi:predicted  nucleic acid-binding Zn-ribbon protein
LVATKRQRQLELRRHAHELAHAHKAREATHDELQKAKEEVAQLKRELASLKSKGSPAPKRAVAAKRK